MRARRVPTGRVGFPWFVEQAGPLAWPSRIRHGSQYMAWSRGVKSQELDRRSLFLSPSAIGPIRAFSNDTSISLGKQFNVTKEISDEENMGAMQASFPSYGDVRPVNGGDDGMKTMDAIYGDKDANRTTVDFSDFKQDTREVTFVQQDVRAQSVSEVSDDEQYSKWPAEDHFCYHNDGVPHVCLIPLSSHRDGAI